MIGHRFRPLQITLALAVLGFGTVTLPLSAAEPAKTDEGNWDGSWFYINLDVQFGFFMRTQDALPELSVEYRSRYSPESFRTDWTGKSSYFLGGRPASFEMRITERDANEIKGTWRWEKFQGRARTLETGNFTLYRSGDGRKLVLKMEDLQRITYDPDTDEETARRSVPRVWGFPKASRRIVRWVELPF